MHACEIVTHAHTHSGNTHARFSQVHLQMLQHVSNIFAHNRARDLSISRCYFIVEVISLPCDALGLTYIIWPNINRCPRSYFPSVIILQYSGAHSATDKMRDRVIREYHPLAEEINKRAQFQWILCNCTYNVEPYFYICELAFPQNTLSARGILVDLHRYLSEIFAIRFLRLTDITSQMRGCLLNRFYSGHFLNCCGCVL